MKILRVIAGTHVSGGGPIEGIRQITKALSTHGHTTEVASLDREDSPWLKRLEFNVYPLGTEGDNYLNAPRLRNWLIDNARRYDIVVHEGLWNPTSFATWRAMRKTKCGYVVYAHGMLDPWFRKAYPIKHRIKQLLWFMADGRLVRDAAYVLFTTEEEKLRARKSFWPRWYNERVVGYGTGDLLDPSSNATRIQAFRRLLPDLADRPFLLFLSRIHPKKACDLLIKAFAKVAQSRPNVQLVLAGPDEMGLKPGLETLTWKLGIGRKVHWPGLLEGEAKWGAFLSCDAFVLPSHQENFGVAVAEAMASARPVLITNKVNIWREVEGCGGGLVANDDLVGIVQLLESFFHLSEAEKADMSKKSRLGFLTHFEISHVAHTLVPLLEEVARSCRRE